MALSFSGMSDLSVFGSFFGFSFTELTLILKKELGGKRDGIHVGNWVFGLDSSWVFDSLMGCWGFSYSVVVVVVVCVCDNEMTKGL